MEMEKINSLSLIVFDNFFHSENGEEWKTTKFEPTPVMSTYLLAFAVSEFRNTTETVPIEFSVYSSLTSLNSMKYALEVGKKALKTLEEYVGLNYTLGKMDFIAIDDFLMGAMVRSDVKGDF
jgi:aminopeptidase N